MTKKKKVVIEKPFIIPVVDSNVGKEYAVQQQLNRVYNNMVADILEFWNPWKFLK